MIIKIKLGVEKMKTEKTLRIESAFRMVTPRLKMNRKARRAFGSNRISLAINLMNRREARREYLISQLMDI